MSVLTAIIEILVGGFTQMATGIGTGLNQFVESIFVKVPSSGGAMTLTTFGTIVIVFAGVALAIGLSRWVVNWLTSLGN